MNKGQLGILEVVSFVAFGNMLVVDTPLLWHRLDTHRVEKKKHGLCPQSENSAILLWSQNSPWKINGQFVWQCSSTEDTRTEDTRRLERKWPLVLNLFHFIF